MKSPLMDVSYHIFTTEWIGKLVVVRIIIVCWLSVSPGSGVIHTQWTMAAPQYCHTQLQAHVASRPIRIWPSSNVLMLQVKSRSISDSFIVSAWRNNGRKVAEVGKASHVVVVTGRQAYSGTSNATIQIRMCLWLDTRPAGSVGRGIQDRCALALEGRFS